MSEIILSEIETEIKPTKLSVKEYNKIYYETNKTKIRAGQQTKVSCCRCNRKVNSQNMTKHMKTKCCKNQMVKDIETLKYSKLMFESLGLEMTADIVNDMISKLNNDKE